MVILYLHQEPQRNKGDPGLKKNFFKSFKINAAKYKCIQNSQAGSQSFTAEKNKTLQRQKLSTKFALLTCYKTSKARDAAWERDGVFTAWVSC